MMMIMIMIMMKIYYERGRAKSDFEAKRNQRQSQMLIINLTRFKIVGQLSDQSTHSVDNLINYGSIVVLTRTWSSLVRGDECSYQPNCQTNALNLLFCW